MNTDSVPENPDGGSYHHRGGCHCGRVRFVALGPRALAVLDCNCSICRMSGYLQWIVAAGQFRLLSGADDLHSYRFGSGIAQHQFCRHCGIKAFYIPRSHPDGIDINVRCLDDDPERELIISAFDGRNWEQNVGRIQH